MTYVSGTYSADDLQLLLAGMTSAARAGAAVVTGGARRLHSLTWETKGESDYVTEIDRGSESRITETLHGSLSDVFGPFPVLGEESWPDRPVPAGLSFVVDPLDGTTNFLHALPIYAISIAALHDGSPIAGLVFDVTRDIMYSAMRARGASAQRVTDDGVCDHRPCARADRHWFPIRRAMLTSSCTHANSFR